MIYLNLSTSGSILNQRPKADTLNKMLLSLAIGIEESNNSFISIEMSFLVVLLQNQLRNWYVLMHEQAESTLKINLECCNENLHNTGTISQKHHYDKINLALMYEAPRSCTVLVNVR